MRVHPFSFGYFWDTVVQSDVSDHANSLARACFAFRVASHISVTCSAASLPAAVAYGARGRPHVTRLRDLGRRP